jgi:hypothetical protein
MALSRYQEIGLWLPQSREKFENRLPGLTILLFLCFEQLTEDPIFLFRTPHLRLLLRLFWGFGDIYR